MRAFRVLWTLAFASIVAVSWLLLDAANNIALARTVVVPVPSISVKKNICYRWVVAETYTATAVPASVVDQLQGFTVFSYEDHFHAGGYPGGVGGWNRLTAGYLHDMTGTPDQKLATINTKIFNTPVPSVGMTRTVELAHTGTCAYEEGLRECVGVFVSNSKAEMRSREPTTFPFGMCSGVPPVGVDCSFDTSYASIDLGVGGVGDRRGSSSISVSCSRPVVYRVSVLDHSNDPVGFTVRDVTIEGGPSPFLSAGVNARETLSVTVVASASAEGHFATQRILRIDIP